jgi:hypothetical protein
MVCVEKDDHFIKLNNSIDHSMPIKIGQEIIRMRHRLDTFPSESSGMPQLKKCLERMELALNDNGYEIVDMLKNKYQDGMVVEARFIPSDNIPIGERLITKIIKPQINYNGHMIQMAEIEVSFNI